VSSFTVLRLERWHRVGFAVLGWLVIVVAPQLLSSLTRMALRLLVIGGVLYTVGAIVLARTPSDPHSTVLGYHDVWHTFVVGANACQDALVTPFRTSLTGTHQNAQGQARCPYPRGGLTPSGGSVGGDPGLPGAVGSAEV
jgi:Haemolysin-III related